MAFDMHYHVSFSLVEMYDQNAYIFLCRFSINSIHTRVSCEYLGKLHAEGERYICY